MIEYYADEMAAEYVSERNENRSDILADIRDARFRDPLGSYWQAENVLRSDSDRREYEATLERYPVPNMIQAISERWSKDRADLLRLVRNTLAESISYMPEPNGGRKAGFRKNRDEKVHYGGTFLMSPENPLWEPN